MKTPRNLLALLSVCALLAGGLPAATSAHDDVTPRAVGTHTLPQLGVDWRQDSPHRTGPAHDEALRTGALMFNQNCVHYHGPEAISGGIAPGPRKLNIGCVSLVSTKQKGAYYDKASQYFTATVRHGCACGGHVYMSPSRGVLTQEVVRSIKTYLESRHVQEQQVSLPPLAAL